MSYKIIAKYLAKKFLLSLALTLAIIVVIIFLVDIIELMRRTAMKGVTIKTILLMSFYKVPLLIQELSPFIILLSGLVCFRSLAMLHETVVFRACGLSVIQIVLPAMISAFMIGLFILTVLNPIAAIMMNLYEKMNDKYIKGYNNIYAVASGSGIWLQEGNQNDEKMIIHAGNINQSDLQLNQVTLFILDKNRKFISRIDAPVAKLANKEWCFRSAKITGLEASREEKDNICIASNMSIEQLQDSFKSPSSISFWSMPEFITTLRMAGLRAIKHQIYWYNLLILPIFLALMAMLSVNFALMPERFGKTTRSLFKGIVLGFIIYFGGNIIHTMGNSGDIPPIIASFVPVIITGAFTLAVTLHIEDKNYYF